MIGSDQIYNEKLSDKNAPEWFIRVMLLLMRDALWYVVENGLPQEPAAKDLTADQSAKSVIGLRLSTEHLDHVRTHSTSKALWDKLKSIYAAKSNASYASAAKSDARKISLLDGLLSLKMLASETVSAYIARARQLASEIIAVGIVLDTTLLIIITLRGLSTTFNSYVAAFYVTALPKDLDELESKLLPIEQSMAAAAKAEAETVALFSGICHNCNRPGHMARDCRQPPRPYGSQPSTSHPQQYQQQQPRRIYPECKYCGKTNHPEEKCHKGKRLQRKAAVTASASVAKAQEEPVIIFSALPQTPLRGVTDYPELPSVPEAIKASWVVDTGAAVHITPKALAAAFGFST
ncbi:hypothetical protein GPECTOR_8g309 [Gonium pectorale]|uniref:CCHC-type domain-containing protein n=1 Tax=Gonium pectorale TaxID=33097 RepID=A0A150GSZ1_GONPE|nr:hypothetical protein GPECTOR_8g309 [Gonium pectorale]|eukprot:KXZ52933.1 hypothetical protein GPECTOR_8g309 [Gonium pectorale]